MFTQQLWETYEGGAGGRGLPPGVLQGGHSTSWGQEKHGRSPVVPPAHSQAGPETGQPPPRAAGGRKAGRTGFTTRSAPRFSVPQEKPQHTGHLDLSRWEVGAAHALPFQGPLQCRLIRCPRGDPLLWGARPGISKTPVLAAPAQTLHWTVQRRLAWPLPRRPRQSVKRSGPHAVPPCPG